MKLLENISSLAGSFQMVKNNQSEKKWFLDALEYFKGVTENKQVSIRYIPKQYSVITDFIALKQFRNHWMCLVCNILKDCDLSFDDMTKLHYFISCEEKSFKEQKKSEEYKEWIANPQNDWYLIEEYYFLVDIFEKEIIKR